MYQQETTDSTRAFLVTFWFTLVSSKMLNVVGILTYYGQRGLSKMLNVL